MSTSSLSQGRQTETEPPEGLVGGRHILRHGATWIELHDHGARLHRCVVPDARGRLADIALGLPDGDDPAASHHVMGAICGRYGNRISDGTVRICGQDYRLSVNEPPHSLHGGAGGFSTLVWKGARVPERNAVEFSLLSRDGDQGWPGSLAAVVRYTLEDANTLVIGMTARTDRPTYVNLLFHGYWNLGGHDSGTIDRHQLQIRAQRTTPKQRPRLPSGAFADVRGTELDFRALRTLGGADGTAPRPCADNFCLDHPANPEEPHVRLYDPASGRRLSIWTDQPGVQVYAADSWQGLPGKDGAVYGSRSGLALETQAYPNTPNIPAFQPKPLLPGDVYRHRMRFRFDSA